MENTQSQTKKLHRSSTDRIIGGVAGGVAQYFEVDSLLVRLIFLGIAAISQIVPAIVAYLIAMVLIPKDGEKGNPESSEKIKEATDELKERAEIVVDTLKKAKPHNSRGSFLGLILVLLGLVILFNQLLPALAISGKFWWPSFLILTGFYLIFRQKSPQ